MAGALDGLPSNTELLSEGPTGQSDLEGQGLLLGAVSCMFRASTSRRKAHFPLKGT